MEKVRRIRSAQDRAGVLNVLNNYLIPFIGQVQAAKAALLASNIKLQQLKAIMDDFFDIAKQMAKEANVTLAHESRNTFVYEDSDSSFLLGTGNRSVTLVDENGDTHLYTINTEPFYDSPTTYPDGSINYYPSGIVCTPERVNDDLLYIEPDGSYTVTKKNKTQYHYSFYGQLEKITDTNGNEIEFVYDTSHKLVKITDGFDRNTDITYAGGRIAKITDPKNRTVGYAYDSEGRLVSVTDPQGDTVTYEYNANFISAIVKPGESRRTYNYVQLGDKYVIDSVTDEKGYSDKFIYNPEQKYTEYINESRISEKHYYNDKNLETKVVYSDGSYIEIQYDEKNNMISRTDELGKTTLFEYDAVRNLTQTTDANGYSERWTYNQWNKVSQYTDKLGNVITYQYDPKGNLTSVTFPDYSSMSYGYNEKGQLVSETDQLGNASQLSYNNVGYIETVTGREGNITRQSTDAIGNVTSITNAKENATSFAYNMDNKLVQLTDALGKSERFEYDSRKNLVKMIDKNGSASTLEYDKRNKLIKTTSPLGETTVYIYREDGRIVSEILNNTSTTIYTYDQRGRLAVKTQKETSVTRSYQYDPKGQVVIETDPNGNATRYFYDNLGRVTRTTDPENNDIYAEYDGKGRIYAKTDANGNRTRYEYDSMDRLIHIYDPLNYYTENHYNPKGLLVTYTDKNWNTTSFDYDKNGRKTKETDALGNTIVTTYDSTGLVKSITNKKGDTTTFEYDALGRTIQEIDPLAGVISYIYDPNRNTTSVTDRNGNTTKFDYDKLNRVVVKTDPYASTTKLEYNYLGKTSAITDALLNKTTYNYDELGRLIKETNPMAETSTFAYDKNSNLISVIDPIGRIKGNRYDKLNRKIEEINGLGEITKFEYDPVGNMMKTTDPQGHEVQYQYDKRNQLVVETNQLGNIQTFAYDANGNTISKIDFNGKIIGNTYDALNRLVKTVFADGTNKEMSYDEAGNIVTAKNQDSDFGYQYDKLGRLVRSEDRNLDKTLVYGYDSNGNRTSISYLDTGKTTKYAYGKMNELLAVADSEGGVTKYQYDKLIRETKKAMPNNIVTETSYDAVGRITFLRNYSQERYGKQEDMKSFAYMYNAAGERIYQVDQDGKITAYEYDKASRLVKTLYPFGQGKEREDFEERLDAGLYPEKGKDNGWGLKVDFTSLSPYKFIEGFSKLEDDLDKCMDGHKDVYESHKKTNWPQTWKWIPGEGAMEFATRLKLGSATDADNGKWKNRLDTNQWMWTETFTYDGSNNRATKANGWGQIGYSYNEANQMLSSGNREYQYDLNGNMIQEALGDAKVDYTYSLENRIVEVYNNTKGFAGKCGDSLEEGVEYSYDVFGRRNTRTEYSLIDKHDWHSKQWKKEANTSYMYDGQSLTIIAELYDNNFTIPHSKNYNWGNKYSPMAEYVYAKGSIVSRKEYPDYKHANGWYDKNSQKTYYSQDILGSTVLLTDSFGHNNMEYAYDSFGTAYQGTFDSNTYGYTGKSFDSETGLYNYGFRDYISEAGRWTSEDPIQDGSNWYVYGNNNPLRYADPSGLAPLDAEETKNNPEPEIFSAKITSGVMKAVKNISASIIRVFAAENADVQEAFTAKAGKGPSTILTSGQKQQNVRFGNRNINEPDPASNQPRPAQTKLSNQVAEWAEGDIEPVKAPKDQNGKTLPAPDYKFTSGPPKGKTFDIMYTVDAAEKIKLMNRQLTKSPVAIEKAIEDIEDHLNKSDFVVMDFRNLSTVAQYAIEMYVNYGACSAPEKVIIVR
jgi:RHS repeat-associated protein